MFTLIALVALAAEPAAPDPVEPATRAWEAGLDTERKAMAVLGSWSVANLAVGLPAGLATDGQSRGFHLGNAGWNVVNLGIAGAGALGARRRTRAGFPGVDAVYEPHRRLRTALAINMGLDLTYIAGGLLLASLAERDDRIGLGHAIALQGGFLLAFDTTFLAVHHRRTRP